ncbi:hypothetical protein ZWY2020_048982 [Hordeum vulgare]|nr:hypothetical protein ZWY2020_048982 [Hordeum vulgare]
MRSSSALSPSSSTIRHGFGMLFSTSAFDRATRRLAAPGILLLQQSAPVSTFAPVTRRNKRSRRPRLQRWVQHAQARQSASSQVAVLESVVVAPPSAFRFSIRRVSFRIGSRACGKYMANSHESPRQTGRNEHEVGETSGARRQPRRSASRRTRQTNVEVFRTPVLNLAAAAKIADSLQPTDSEAGRGIEQIRALLHTAQQQNSAVSKSQNRIHNSYVRAKTHRSVHSPGSHQRHRGGNRSMNPEDRHRSRTPPRVGPTGPDIMMIGVRSVTLMIQGPTQEDISPRGGSTGAGPTAMVMI